MRFGLRSRHWRGCAVPGLTAIDCPNKDECGTIIQLTEEDRVELYRARLEDNRRIVERVRLTSSRRHSRGIPKTHDLGFCFIAPALRDLLSSGLTVAPQTITASPAAKMFFPALISRSMPFVPQLGQSQLRTFNGNLSITKPQW